MLQIQLTAALKEILKYVAVKIDRSRHDKGTFRLQILWMKICLSCSQNSLKQWHYFQQWIL